MISLFDEKPFDEGFPLDIDEAGESGAPEILDMEGMGVFSAVPRVEFASGREPVCYSVRDGHELKMYVFTPYVENIPDELKPTLPLLIYIQGSAFHRQNLMKNVPQIPGFAARGFAVALIEVTPSETAPFPAAIEDVKAAIRAAKKNAAKLRIDPDKIILWGDSSGAADAVLTAVTGDGVCDGGCEDGVSCSVAAVVDYYGPVDILALTKEPGPMRHGDADSPEGWLIGHRPIEGNEERARAASAVTYISKEKRLPPFLIMHGDADVVVAFSQSAMLYKKLRETGHEAEFYKVPGAGHSTPEFWSESTFDFVESFIRKHI